MLLLGLKVALFVEALGHPLPVVSNHIGFVLDVRRVVVPVHHHLELRLLELVGVVAVVHPPMARLGIVKINALRSTCIIINRQSPALGLVGLGEPELLLVDLLGRGPHVSFDPWNLLLVQHLAVHSQPLGHLSFSGAIYDVGLLKWVEIDRFRTLALVLSDHLIEVVRELGFVRCGERRQDIVRTDLLVLLDGLRDALLRREHGSGWQCFDLLLFHCRLLL